MSDSPVVTSTMANPSLQSHLLLQQQQQQQQLMYSVALRNSNSTLASAQTHANTMHPPILQPPHQLGPPIQPQYFYPQEHVKHQVFALPPNPTVQPSYNYHPVNMRPNPGAPPFQPMGGSYPGQVNSQNLPLPYISSIPPAQNSINGPSQPWHADVYAPSFVPSCYTQINSMPAVPVRSIPPPSINYPGYISAFAGTSLLHPLPPYPRLLPPAGNRSQSPSPETYLPYFQNLFLNELSAQHQNVRQYDMYNVPLYPQDPASYQFKLMVQGIREDCPTVAIGDVIHLRQLRSNTMQMYPAVGFTGVQYEAYIYAIDRQAGFLILRIDELRLESGMFNVSFLVQDKLFGPQTRAMYDISKLLATGESNASDSGQLSLRSSHNDPAPSGTSGPGSSWARKMLFPEKSDGVMQTTLTKGMLSHRWFDTELNFEQQKAVNAIIERNYGTVPYLISGPPGTGKTKTIVEATLQLIFAHTAQKHHILLCAPSNQAADTLAKRLIPHLSPRVLLRMISPSRSFAEVPSELLSYCFVQNDCFSLPDWRKLMAYRLIVTTCADCSMLVEARCTNRDLARWQRIVNSGLEGEEFPGLVDGMDVGQCAGPVTTNRMNLHWSALLVDEAAQGTEPDVLIPLSVVTPPEEFSTELPIFVMAGDQKQLGPRTASKSPQLETSLLDRLFSRTLYFDHPLSRQGLAKVGQGTAPEWITRLSASMLPYISPPFTNLIRNYRSHPAILAVPSSLFYHDTLVQEAREVDELQHWDGWKGRKWPVLFMCNGGQDELHEEGVSFYNLREVTIACKTAQRLVDGGHLKPHEIAIMSPFREQVRRLRNTLRGPPFKLRGVNVGPLEAYQGSEHKFVILCTTRTRERFLDHDVQKGLGIIFESKKFNVAMTRARQGLVVIGNPWILHKDPNWLAFLSFCWRNGTLEYDFEEPMHGSCDSKDSTVVGSPAPGVLDTKMSPSINDGTNVTGALSMTGNSTSISNVNLWAPSQDERDSPQYLSRLEQGLMLKEKFAGKDGYIPKAFNARYEEDDSMWTAAIAAEEALRSVDFDLVLQA